MRCHRVTFGTRLRPISSEVNENRSRSLAVDVKMRAALAFPSVRPQLQNYLMYGRTPNFFQTASSSTSSSLLYPCRIEPNNMNSHTLYCFSRLAQSHGSHSPPTFLAPVLETLSPRLAAKSRGFSTSLPSAAPQKSNKDKSRKRGVSVIHRTGPRWPLSMQKYPLPVPVANPEARKKFETPEDHGLWGFFNGKKDPMETPEEHASHGTITHLSPQSSQILITV